jgi:hypothetical protein
MMTTICIEELAITVLLSEEEEKESDRWKKTANRGGGI